MRRHGIHHARRRIAVMAGRAIVDDAGMIEGCRDEAARVMADTAILIGHDMTGFLGCRETGAVTGRAVIHDARVTKARRFETSGLMAVDAIAVGRHMEVAFAGSSITVMTGCTVVDDTLVFKPCIGKGSRCMTYRAILGDGDVRRVDFGSGAGCVDTIVTRRAVINDTGMIEYSWCESPAGHVTDTAILGGYHMGRIDLRIFASGGDTVMAALLAGWPRLANTLLEQTTHPAQINSLGFRPMHVATIRGYRTMVIALLDKEVDIDQTDARGNTALMLAAKNRKTDMLKLLLDRGANYGITNRKKQSAIDFVFAADYPAGQALLASYGIAPGTTGPGTVDPAATIQLAAASKLDQFKTVVEQRGGRYAGWPLLNIAIELGEIPITQEIIAEKPDLNATGPDGNSAIHVAARKGDSVTLKPLLANGVDINAINARNETALYLAVESDCLECVRLLLANKADPAIADKLKITPLEVAIRNEQTEIAAVLLKSPTSYAGIHRVLLLAIERNMEDLSLRLIKRDSRLGERDDKGRSALWHSADRGLIKTSVALIKSGKIDINSQDSTGHCALAQATRGGHLAVVHLLINADADLNIRTNAANTILMLAVLAKKPAIVELLMTRAIDINAQDNVGDTALMLAAATGQNELLEMLIKAGADLQLRNKEDLNAFQIANNSGHQETAEMIREKSNVLFKLFN